MKLLVHSSFEIDAVFAQPASTTNRPIDWARRALEACICCHSYCLIRFILHTFSIGYASVRFAHYSMLWLCHRLEISIGDKHVRNQNWSAISSLSIGKLSSLDDRQRNQHWALHNELNIFKSVCTRTSERKWTDQVGGEQDNAGQENDHTTSSIT